MTITLRRPADRATLTLAGSDCIDGGSLVTIGYPANHADLGFSFHIRMRPEVYAALLESRDEWKVAA